MLLKIVNHEVADLPYLLRLVLKYIYEPQNMSLVEEGLMQKSFINWNNKINKNEEEAEILERLAWLVKQNQEGKFDARKVLFKEHNIDYKKFHRLPEAYDLTRERLAELEKINEQNKKDAITRFA